MQAPNLFVAEKTPKGTMGAQMTDYISFEKKGPSVLPLAAGSGLYHLWLITLLISVVVFSARPQIDLAFSSIFYLDGRFSATEMPLLESIRKSIWTGSAALGIVSLLSLLIAVIREQFLGISYRVWNTVVAVYVLGPGLMANIILKNYWGRARPANINEFGGTADFTPALMPANECAKNCSFVSGETSGAVAFAVGVWVLSDRVKNFQLRQGLRGIAIFVAVVAAILRVAQGRHFLSDVVFAALIVSGLGLLFEYYRRKSSPIYQETIE